MEYILFVVGLAMLLCGASVLVDSAAAIARRLRVSDFVIGLTIVGIGTSAPELFISLGAALSGHGDLALGNVVGSNICNTLLILGSTGVILPFAIEREQIRRDIPFVIIASVVIAVMVFDDRVVGGTHEVSRGEAAVLLVLFAGYMAYVVRASRKNGCDPVGETPEAVATGGWSSRCGMPLLCVLAVAGLAMLVCGGRWFLQSAVWMAQQWGVSESVISITVVALGTSLPELVTCVMAAVRGNAQLALGNVIGSNIFNILLVCGLPAVLVGLPISDIRLADIAMLIVSAVLCAVVVFTFGRRRFDRIEGVIFLALYAGYNFFLYLR